MLYTDLQNTLVIKAAEAADVSGAWTPDADFLEEMPRFVEYGENRIYRKLKLLATRAQNVQCQTEAGFRTINLGAITSLSLSVEGFALLLPQGTLTGQQATRLPYEPTSLDLIDIFFPTENTPVAPGSAQQRWWAMLDDANIVIGPTPDNTYNCEVTGLFQPAPISATNVQTYLSTVYPDILVAACMIAVSAYLRDYGSMSDDPKMAMSWEETFQGLIPDCLAEEQRRRSAGDGWNQNSPTPLAGKVGA